MKNLRNYLLIAFCVLVGLIIFAGCDSKGSISPIIIDPPISIKKVDGLMLFHNGNVIATVNKETVNGIVPAQMNENSDIYEVEFLDENGEIINEHSQQYRLAWDYDKQYATFEEHTDWEFCIYGKKSGETTFQLQLKNGGSVDYSSPAIPLEVK